MKSIFIGILLLIFLIPLGQYPISFYESINFPQLIIVYIIFLLFLFMCWSYTFTKNSSVKKSPLYLPLVLFILWGTISLKWTVSIPATSIQIFYFLFYSLVFFLSLNVVDNDKSRETLLLVLLFSTFLVSVYAIYQYFWGLEETRAYVLIYKNEVPLSSSSNFMSRLNTDRAFSTFIYPNALASFLMMVFPFSVFYPIFCKGKRIISAIISLLILFAFILTFSKGGAIALVLSWIVFWVVRMKKKHKIIGILLTIVLIALAILFAYKNDYIAGKTKPFKDSSRVRVQYAQAGLEMIKEKPLLGFGLGSFGRVYAKYKLPEAEETQMAHNNFLQIWTELGIVGFLIFLSIFTFYFRQMNHGVKNLGNLSSIQKVFVFGGYVSVLSFVFHSLGDFSLYVFSISSILFMLMGVSCGVISEKKAFSTPKGISVVLFVISFSLIFLLSRVFIAERHYIKAMNSDSADKTIKELNLSVYYCDWGENEYRLSYHYILSQVYKQKMFQEGIVLTPEIIKHLNQAIKYDKCRSIYYRELAGVSLLEKEGDKAIGYMKKAVSCYPAYGHNHLMLGDVYMVLGEKEEASKEYRVALEYDASLKELIDERMQQFK